MDACKTENVILQENGIIRNSDGIFLGRMVEDIDGLVDKHYNRGRLEALGELKRFIAESEENV